MQEQRKFVRLNLNIEVTWRKINEIDNSKKDLIDTAKNISEGGICLMVDETIKPEDKLQLELRLPTEKVITSTGRTVWVEEFEIIGGRREKKYEAGIEFLDISDRDREQIKQFVFTFGQKK